MKIKRDIVFLKILFMSTLLILINTIIVSAAPSWHIQYNPTPTNPVADVHYWNLDLYDVPATTIKNLTSKGVFVICYFSAGSYEDWRSDASQFPARCIGNSNGWPGENWINTSCPEVRQIMKNRIDLGISKGCSGFDPDNMDGYSNNNGMGLTKNDAINYYNFLANYTHSKGKKIGLKNALEIISNVLVNMDWAVNEQCYQYNECSYMTPVINAGKPVFNIEYGDSTKIATICPKANAAGFSTLIKKMALDSFEIPCNTSKTPINDTNNINLNNTISKYILTCQNFSNYQTNWSSVYCNAKDCGTDKYISCEKKRKLWIKQYREVCQKTNIQNVSCSLNPTCLAGYSEIKRESC